MWRYAAFLPLSKAENRVSLGEGMTPLRRATRLGERLGLENIYLKDESVNPTGSFKARGMSVAVSRAQELGARRIALPSAGYAAVAAAAYGAAAGLEVRVFLPEASPASFARECNKYGALVTLVEGTIADAMAAMGSSEEGGWYDLSTGGEPYRLEGKKTMGYELAEQLDWSLPDVIVYPTGGGTGLVGMWKAFGEMEKLGWIGDGRPRMVAVQSSGCAPVVDAYERHAAETRPWKDARTIAAGLQVPRPIWDSLILDALYASGGRALAVSDDEILEAIGEIASLEGVLPSPEAAATWAALKELKEDGAVGRDERIVLFMTGGGARYDVALGGDSSS